MLMRGRKWGTVPRNWQHCVFGNQSWEIKSWASSLKGKIERMYTRLTITFLYSERAVTEGWSWQVAPAPKRWGHWTNSPIVCIVKALDGLDFPCFGNLLDQGILTLWNDTHKGGRKYKNLRNEGAIIWEARCSSWLMCCAKLCILRWRRILVSIIDGTVNSTVIRSAKQKESGSIWESERSRGEHKMKDMSTLVNSIERTCEKVS